MELEITTTIHIDIDKIIEEGNLNINSTDDEINQAIDDYVAGLEDMDYYLIGDFEKLEIFNKIQEKLDIA